MAGPLAAILEPLYRDSNEYAKLIGIHEIQAQHATSSERKVELLHRIAELYEIALDDAPSAFMSFARALGEDPANTTTQYMQHPTQLRTMRAYGSSSSP